MSNGHLHRSDLRSRRLVICHPATRPKLGKKEDFCIPLYQVLLEGSLPRIGKGREK